MPFVCGYLGNLTKDPTLATTQSGKTVCKFTVANTEGWGNSKRTDYIPCISWDKTANTINTHFRKGDSLIIEGAWENRPWQKNDKGYDIANWQFTVKKVVFPPKRANHSDEDDDYVPSASMQMAGVDSQTSADSTTEFAPITDDLEDLPF